MVKNFSRRADEGGAKRGRRGWISRFLGQKWGDWRWEDGNAVYSIDLQIVVPTLRGTAWTPQSLRDSSPGAGEQPGMSGRREGGGTVGGW